jgi:cell division protein ZapA (FtsZ GTPase activity inhibitor)
MAETAKHIRNVTTSKVAVMTAMTIADELFRLRQSVEQAQTDNAARLDNLIAVSRRLGSSAQRTTDASSLPDSEDPHDQ